MHASKSGSTVPWRMPGLALSCLLTSLTMPMAALPTDLMVKAEKRKGNIAPSSNPAKMAGSVIEMSLLA